MDDKKTDREPAALAWIRGFTRGLTNDPPDDCPDYPFDAATSGEYTEGWRLGKDLGSVVGKGIDRSSTLIVRGCPDGTEVTCVPQPYGCEVKVEDLPKQVTPLRRGIGQPANWNIDIGDHPSPEDVLDATVAPIEDALKEIGFSFHLVCLRKNGFEILRAGDDDVTFDQLAELSRVFQTKDINLCADSCRNHDPDDYLIVVTGARWPE